MAKPKSNATSFKKGKQKTGGRKAGVPNRTTTFVRDAIILAAEAVGSDGAGKDGLVGYLIFVANTNVPAFCSLLGRVLPLQPEPKEEPPYADLSDEELRAELRSRGLPENILIADILEHRLTSARADEEKEREETEAKRTAVKLI